jgi:hypothetical protein
VSLEWVSEGVRGFRLRSKVKVNSGEVSFLELIHIS